MPEPFLKWAGGKRWLTPAISTMYRGGRVVEPFLGSGATFFALAPEIAVLGDTNGPLIETFQVVRDQPEDLIARLRRLKVDSETFARIRRSRPRSAVGRAARFVYLNRTAFNGLYRVNKQGQFNVPFGCKPGTTSVCPDSIRACASRLANADLVAADFRRVLAGCRRDDFIYLDPPYTVSHNDNGFNRYNETLFSWADQLSLAAEAARLGELGAHVVVSNADHKSVRALYPRDLFRVRRLQRPSRMAASASHRRITTELLIESRTR